MKRTKRSRTPQSKTPKAIGTTEVAAGIRQFVTAASGATARGALTDTRDEIRRYCEEAMRLLLAAEPSFQGRKWKRKPDSDRDSAGDHFAFGEREAPVHSMRDAATAEKYRRAFGLVLAVEEGGRGALDQLSLLADGLDPKPRPQAVVPSTIADPVEEAIIRALAARSSRLDRTKIGVEIGRAGHTRDEKVIGRKLRRLHDVGLVDYPPKGRQGAAITTAGQQWVKSNPQLPR